MKIEYFDFAETRLTRRHLQIISKLRDGELHKQIADQLGIAKGTVDHTVGYLLGKTRVKNSKELVALAIEQGMERNGVYRGTQLF